MIKNAKFSGYYFDVNLNIWGDFQICNSVPLRMCQIASEVHDGILRRRKFLFKYLDPFHRKTLISSAKHYVQIA